MRIWLVLLVMYFPQAMAWQVAGWKSPAAMSEAAGRFVKAQAEMAKMHVLCQTQAGTDYQLIEVGREIHQPVKSRPAVLVVANLEGTSPLASEAALRLLDELAKRPEMTERLTWYILPVGNPDGALRLTRKPVDLDGRTFRPWNDDMDEQTDEDGPDDLNGDGWITQMRVASPEGTLIPDEKNPRLLKRADPLKGEKGIWKVYPEGLDNDGDGQYNEDSPGGTQIGITFPFAYPYNQPGAGAWCGSESETFSLMQFVTAHPEIAMTMTYGSSNLSLGPPRGGRRSAVNLSSIRLPQRYAQMLNADPDKTYSLEEVKELMRPMMPPGTPVDDATVASMLDAGPVVNPLEADVKLYNNLADQYKKYLKGKGWTAKRADAPRDKEGSFEAWAYYQLGLPSFSMDLWALPKPKDSTKNAFLAWNDSLLGGAGFVDWKPFNHPTLGKVEIGGIVPYAETLPIPAQADTLLAIQVPWIFELAAKIPSLEIESVKTDSLGAGIYRIEAWIRNSAQLPFPTAMGQRSKTPPPAIVTLSGPGITFVAGKERTPLEGLASLEQRKLTWLVQTDKASSIRLRVQPVNAFGSESTLELGGKGR